MSTRIDIPGTYNLRDFAGFRVADGVIRERALFRADALHQLTPDTGRDLADLGVRTVIDLRDPNERNEYPNRIPKTVTTIEQPIFPDAASHVSRRLSIFDLTDLIYFQHGNELGQVIIQIANQADDGGILFHCTAGKDRTGAVASLTLLALGADRDEVLTDYAASEQHLNGEWLHNYVTKLRELGYDPDEQTVGLIASTPAEALDQTLTKIDREHGSVLNYLSAHRVDHTVIETLRTRLTNPDL